MVFMSQSLQAKSYYETINLLTLLILLLMNNLNNVLWQHRFGQWTGVSVNGKGQHIYTPPYFLNQIMFTIFTWFGNGNTSQQIFIGKGNQCV